MTMQRMRENEKWNKKRSNRFGGFHPAAAAAEHWARAVNISSTWLLLDLRILCGFLLSPMFIDQLGDVDDGEKFHRVVVARRLSKIQWTTEKLCIKIKNFMCVFNRRKKMTFEFPYSRDGGTRSTLGNATCWRKTNSLCYHENNYCNSMS